MSDILTTGECLCGQVTYTITGEPMRMAQCHCKDCQRATGTGHVNNAFFKSEQLEIKGNLKAYSKETDTGNNNIRHFCPDCGSRIYSEIEARKGIVGVQVGCCDNNDWFSPDFVVYCKSRADWDITTDKVPNHDMMPPPPPKS